jgi:hypothetical protein
MQIKSFLCLEQPNVLIDQNLHPWLLLTSNNFNILEWMNMMFFYGAQTFVNPFCQIWYPSIWAKSPFLDSFVTFFR